MNKRQFLAASAAGVALPAWPQSSNAAGAGGGPGLLTVTGKISRTNRGPLNGALDQLMVKHGAKFDKAFMFDAAMLARLPSVHMQPTLEYDAKPHKLSGPLLSSVIEAAGVAADAPVNLVCRGVDGYTVGVSLALARSYRMIVATTLDGAPMSLGGLGPLWAVYEADVLAAFRDKPLKERFASCPWGLYYIEVRAG